MQLVVLLGVDALVLLQVLGALERLAAHGARVGLQWRVHAEMRRDVVALDALDAASLPAACQAEIVGALAANVRLAQMGVQVLGAWGDIGAVLPLAVDSGLVDDGGPLLGPGVVVELVALIVRR